MEKEQNKRSTILIAFIVIVVLAGIIAFAVYNNRKTEQAAKAAEEWVYICKDRGRIWR